jgi:hypothetical protein
VNVVKLLLAAGVAIAGLCAVWLRGRRGPTHTTGEGIAQLVPSEEARLEAKWTREALKSK